MKPKILIVDDDNLNLATFEAFLGGDGYTLHFATNGPEALRLTRELSPDLVLLDVMMPDMDGFEVCRRLRADLQLCHVPIIMVTALHDSASRLEGLQAGADDFVTKPCSRDEMRARVRTVASLNRFRTIAEQRARFERLYQVAPTGIVLTDSDGRVVAANPRAELLLGGTIAGQRLAYRCPDMAPTLARIIGAAIAGQTVPPQELRCASADAERVLRVRATSVPEDGVTRAMLIFTDATEEVKAREELKRVNGELDQLVRARTRQLEEANALLLSYASFVSHDLRSPLAVMKGYLSMLHEGAVPLAQGAPMIEAAYNATIMMQDMVQNILQLAHDEHAGASGRPAELIDPTAVIEHVWMHVSALYPQVEPTFKIETLPRVPANALLVERVFYNLLSNALKYSASRPTPQVTIGAVATPTGPALFVRDNGVGFDAREAEKLFREFSRLDTAPAGDGFGLGLSLVARLVRAHGGRMWAEGKRGEGATFFVQFGPGGGAPEARSDGAARA